MLIFVVAAVVGVAVGLVLGGRLSALAGVRLRVPALVWVALALQVALGLAPLRSLPDGARFGLVAASYGLVGVWLALNAAIQRTATRAALGLVAAGWLMNLVVMVPNGGMPVSAAALDDSGAPPGLDVEEGHLSKHVELSSSTVLPALGDVVAVPVLKSAVSAGDVIMAVGVAATVATGMLLPGGPSVTARGAATRRRPRRPGPSAGAAASD